MRKGSLVAMGIVACVIAGVAHAAVAPAASATLEVTRAYAAADDTYEHGWHYIIHATFPTEETQLKLRFSDLVDGATVIDASNVRLYTAQASSAADAAHALTLSAANVWSDTVTLDADADESADGRQVDIVVEVKVPQSVASGSFDASYDLQSDAPVSPPFFPPPPAFEI